MKIHTFRLKPGSDFKLEIDEFVLNNRLGAGIIFTAVGSFSEIRFRATHDTNVQEIKGKHLLVSCEGTLARDSSHIHVSFSDRDGKVVGGHLRPGCKTLTTVEVVIAEFPDMKFFRAQDKETGFDELQVREFTDE